MYLTKTTIAIAFTALSQLSSVTAFHNFTITSMGYFIQGECEVCSQYLNFQIAESGRKTTCGTNWEDNGPAPSNWVTCTDDKAFDFKINEWAAHDNGGHWNLLLRHRHLKNKKTPCTTTNATNCVNTLGYVNVTLDFNSPELQWGGGASGSVWFYNTSTIYAPVISSCIGCGIAAEV